MVLFFFDSDFGVFVVGWYCGRDDLLLLRFVNILVLKYLLFVDIYVENMFEGVKVVLVCLIGGIFYWFYGI